jgi:Polyketide cyclase / dehydrase and lipid transport
MEREEKGVTMALVELDIDTPLPPERVIGGLTDFSERRPEIWPGLHPSLYEVRSAGDTWAEVKEGSQAPGMTVWAVEGYDWSVQGTVSWTIKESNLFAPGGSVSAQVDPALGGGSRIHITWNRTGVGVKGRMLVGVIKLSGGKPVAASIKAGLDKMREQQPQSGK